MRNNVRVTMAPNGGWDLCVESEGMVIIEHCSDWHRVERHRRQLERLGSAPQSPIRPPAASTGLNASATDAPAAA